MANGARMEGIDADLFFTFFGLDAINKTHTFAAEMEKLDIPPIPEFIELISDSSSTA